MARGVGQSTRITLLLVRLALVSARQIDQNGIQINGQAVTENSVERDQYSLVSKCYTVQWPPQLTNGEHMVFQSQMRTA